MRNENIKERAQQMFSDLRSAQKVVCSPHLYSAEEVDTARTVCLRDGWAARVARVVESVADPGTEVA